MRMRQNPHGQAGLRGSRRPASLPDAPPARPALPPMRNARKGRAAPPTGGAAGGNRPGAKNA